MYVWYVLLNSTYLLTYLPNEKWHESLLAFTLLAVPQPRILFAPLPTHQMAARDEVRYLRPLYCKHAVKLHLRG